MIKKRSISFAQIVQAGLAVGSQEKSIFVGHSPLHANRTSQDVQYFGNDVAFARPNSMCGQINE